MTTTTTTVVNSCKGDPERLKTLQAAFQSVVRGVQVGVGAEGVMGLTQPLTYVVDAGGMWEVRTTPVGHAIRKVDKIEGVKAELTEGVVLRVPKIPWAFYQQAVAWFRAVNLERKAEAFIQVWWNPEAGEHYLYVPKQEVSGARVKHYGDHDQDHALGHVCVLDLHSHNTMNAFFSSIDDDDEQRMERMYGVVGKVDQEIPESRWRYRSGQAFLTLALSDVWALPLDATFQVNVTLAEVLEGKTITVTADVFRDAEFPPEWMAQLETPVSRTFTAYGNGSGVPNGEGGFWWDHEDWENWEDRAVAAAARAKGDGNVAAGWAKRDQQVRRFLDKGTGGGGRTGRTYFEKGGRIWERDERTGSVVEMGRADKGWEGPRG
jgi:PRTRC genetic system protein A